MIAGQVQRTGAFIQVHRSPLNGFFVLAIVGVEGVAGIAIGDLDDFPGEDIGQDR
jgi:hypothetical protein